MAKIVKLVTSNDLSTDFTVKGDKVHLNKSIRQMKIDYAVGKNIATTNNPIDYERQERRQLTLHSSGLGKIHLDFKAALEPVARLNNDVIYYAIREGFTCEGLTPVEVDDLSGSPSHNAVLDAIRNSPRMYNTEEA